LKQKERSNTNAQNTHYTASKTQAEAQALIKYRIHMQDIWYSTYNSARTSTRDETK